MAENKSGAQHLASLDLEISGILESLKKADEQIQEYGKAAGKNFNSAFSEGLGDTSQSTPEPLKSEPIKSTTDAVSKLNTEYGKLAKTVQTFDAAGKLASQKTTFIDENGVQTVLKYNDALEQTGKTITENTAKQEADYKKVQSQIESLIEKQTKFNNLVASQKSSSANREIISQNQELIKSAKELNDSFSKQEVSLSSAKEQLENYNSKAKELSSTYETAGTKGESFLEKVSDKAKWLAAFYVVNELKNGFFETIDIIKSTEDAVVDLQRVLNDDTISQSKMSSELYDVAYEYGRTFDEVAEVSTQFAQAGYDWADTMELTRGTMLALNTAELDVTQSTEGLIAILSQWNLTAEDYADVIDKINITADNFSVTSENIVAALQRASSSAKNANISLEQTIGIITALAEATGRSGENIGTALNSLIIYTSKANALKTFAEVGSDAMKQVVADYQAGAASIYDVWLQLSEEIEDLSQQQQEALFKGEDFQELATELESALGDVYGAAGTYRQNYFIALLNDIQTAEDAVEGMAEASGYSAEENEKYMASLTASWNQLKSALAELAVQIGDAGLLDLLKMLTDVATAAVKATNSIGGIVPILTIVAGIMTTIKQQKIADTFSEIGSSFKYLRQEASVAITTISAAPGIIGKVNAAITALSAGTMTLAGMFGIATAAIGVLFGAYSSISNAIEERNRQALESANASLEEANAIKELQQEYSDIVNYTGDVSEKTQQLTEFKKKLIEQYGYEKDAVESLNGARQEEINFLDEEYQSSVKNSWIKAKDQYLDAVDALEKANKDINLGDAMSMDSKTLNILGQYLDIVETTDAAGAVTSRSFLFDTSSLEEQRDILADILTSNIDNEAVLALAQSRYDDITKQLEKWSDAYNTGTEVASEYFFVQENTLDLIEKINDAQSQQEQKEAYDELVKSVEDTNFGLEAQEAIIDTISEMFPQFAESAVEATEGAKDSVEELSFDLESLDENIQSLSDELASFQSAYATVNSALEEYNQNGILSLDTIQSIINLGPEYISMLESVDGKLRLNEEAVGNLINAQRENVAQMLQQSLAADTLELAQQYLTESTNESAEANADAKIDADNLEESLANLAGSYLEASASATTYAYAVTRGLGGDQFGDKIEDFKSDVRDLYNTYQNLYNQIASVGADRDYWTGVSSGVEKTGSAAKSAEDKVQSLIDKLNDLRRQREEAAVSLTSDKAIEDNQKLLNQIYSLISGLQDGTVSAEEAAAALESFDDVVSQIKIEESTYKKLIDEQETLASDQIEIQDMLLEKQKERLEAEKDAVEERYDYEEERAEELSDTIQEIQDTWDYFQSRESLLRDIRRASVRSGVEYREAEMEAKESLAQLDIEQFFTWIQNSLDGTADKINIERERQVKGIEDKIQAIDDQMDNLSDIKTLLSNDQVNFYERFGGDLSSLAEKVGNVEEFLQSIGYAVVVDTPTTTATGATDQTVTEIADAVYGGTELTELNVEGIMENFSSIFVQTASAAISAAISSGMTNLSSVIASSIASSVASAGGYSSSSTTNNTVTNVIGSIANVAGSYAAQNLASILFKP